ncbi:hypothetical protein B0H67DRAFT_678011 [Lasiosphaeris hirsuta]|uniref:Protein kinase domain-containing protein n=1 Tax=Lasiosphaeris hirsuta TaxID=260670 RepID=A0AA40E7S1_9PEZI|nr:hypothetical protein B0H67DRAFT_678011 [Lasiosphaeris hirsuta]
MNNTVQWIGPDLRKGDSETYRDGDTLRYLSVWVKWDDDRDRDVDTSRDQNSPERLSEDMGISELEDKRVTAVMAILPGLFTSLAPNVQGVDITPSGEVLATTTDNRAVRFHEPYYPSIMEYGLSSPYGHGGGSSLVHGSAIGPRVAALKFPFRNPSFIGGGLWTGIHILGRLPPHRNVVSMDDLVLEEISGLGVVGYTMPCFDGYTLAKQPAPWSFKLKWLREIMQAVDFLDLECGVINADLIANNILINTATDSVVLIDLGMGRSARRQLIGGKRHHGCPTSLVVAKPADAQAVATWGVKRVTLTVLFHITQHRTLDDWTRMEWEQQNEESARSRENWVKHPDVELDANISFFYDALMAWADKRRDGPLPSDASDSDWVTFGEHRSRPDRVNLSHAPRTIDRIRAGRPVLNWLRPPTSKLDPNRPVLATGRYANEEPAAGFILVPDPSRGFPQPPLGIDGIKRPRITPDEEGRGQDTHKRRATTHVKAKVDGDQKAADAAGTEANEGRGEG